MSTTALLRASAPSVKNLSQLVVEESKSDAPFVITDPLFSAPFSESAPLLNSHDFIPISRAEERKNELLNKAISLAQCPKSVQHLISDEIKKYYINLDGTGFDIDGYFDEVISNDCLENFVISALLYIAEEAPVEEYYLALSEKLKRIEKYIPDDYLFDTDTHPAFLSQILPLIKELQSLSPGALYLNKEKAAKPEDRESTTPSTPPDEMLRTAESVSLAVTSFAGQAQPVAHDEPRSPVLPERAHLVKSRCASTPLQPNPSEYIHYLYERAWSRKNSSSTSVVTPLSACVREVENDLNAPQDPLEIDPSFQELTNKLYFVATEFKKTCQGKACDQSIRLKDSLLRTMQLESSYVPLAEKAHYTSQLLQNRVPSESHNSIKNLKFISCAALSLKKTWDKIDGTQDLNHYDSLITKLTALQNELLPKDLNSAVHMLALILINKCKLLEHRALIQDQNSNATLTDIETSQKDICLIIKNLTKCADLILEPNDLTLESQNAIYKWLGDAILGFNFKKLDLSSMDYGSLAAITQDLIQIGQNRLAYLEDQYALEWHKEMEEQKIYIPKIDFCLESLQTLEDQAFEVIQSTIKQVAEESKSVV